MAPEDNKNIWSVFPLKSAFPYILLIVGIVSIVCAFCDKLYLPAPVQEILKWIGNTLIVGVIIGFMSSYIQFKGIYQKNLSDIIFSYKFLEKLNDKETFEIWKNVSNVLFHLKYPEISSEIFNLINRYYIEKIDFYYANHKMICEINWYDKAAGIIEIREELTYDVVANHTQKINLTNLTTTENYEKNNGGYQFEIESYAVNGTKVEPQLRELVLNGIKHYYIDVPLEGKKVYNIKRVTKEHQNINQDCNIGFKARTLIKDLRLQLHNNISNDIKICFMDRGVLVELEADKGRQNYQEYEYKGLILPRQGYILTLLKNQES